MEEAELLMQEPEEGTASVADGWRWRRTAAKLMLLGGLTLATLEVCLTGNSSPSLHAGMQFVLGLAGQTANSQQACLANEEQFNGICYLQCRIATGGASPKRTGPATCCRSMSIVCFFMQSHTTTSDGLAIGGGAGFGSAAHVPGVGGSCEDNEEPYVGQCYMKCSTLTHNVSATRMGPASCCVGDPGDCLAGKIAPISDPAFEAGGGTGEKAQPHGPDKPQLLTGDLTTMSKNCQPEEERYNGVCYRKCSQITGGRLPYRRGPLTCCKDNGYFVSFFTCMLPTNVQTDPGLNVGYSASGDKVGPHPPGMSVKCLSDEERFAGLCYESCSKLTNGSMPYRIAVTTCCKFPLTSQCGPDDVLVTWQADTGGRAFNKMPHAPPMRPS